MLTDKSRTFRQNYNLISGFFRNILTVFFRDVLNSEGNYPGFGNCTSWDPGVRYPLDLPGRGMKTYSIMHPGGHDAKTAGQFFTGYETFQDIFEECNFQDMYSYVYILKCPFH